uniref:Solute carrier organic anion transporter family member n=1 Tax=Pavo cristatus TaxID=9049 RepID=A0A8C9FXZ8_PAVCR
PQLLPIRFASSGSGDELSVTVPDALVLCRQFFVFCHGLLQLSQLLVSSYLKSSISTIEKRYGLSSKTSGLLASFNEVGNTLLIVFISYFGSRVHRPRFIGCGAILVSLAGFLMSLPHFITGPYEYDQSVASRYSRNLFYAFWDRGRKRPSLEVSAAPPPAPTAPLHGAEPLSALFPAGILFSLTVVGPGVGFMLGSGMLRFYVDIDKVAGDEVQLTNKDPRWVGAWWLGFLVAASLVAVSAVPYFFFPREMGKGALSAPETEEEALTLFSAVWRPLQPRNFPVVLLRNLRHPVYLLVVLAQVNLSAMVAGLATFMGKFLERQFSLTASFANMIIGSVNIPGAMVGIVVGGAILKRFQMSLKQCSAMCVLGMLLCLILAFPLVFLGCPTQKVAGVTYRESSEFGHYASECSLHCNCPKKAYNPICGSDGIEYISPCYAGCSAVSITNNSVLVSHSHHTHILVWDSFVVLGREIPILAQLEEVTLSISCCRSIQPEDKSFAVGIQFMLLRVLAWMPGPVLYGSAIDTTCILWEKKCDRKAACRYYNNNLFRQSLWLMPLTTEAGSLEGVAVKHSCSYGVKVESGIILVPQPQFTAFFPSQVSFPPKCTLSCCYGPLGNL